MIWFYYFEEDIPYAEEAMNESTHEINFSTLDALSGIIEREIDVAIMDSSIESITSNELNVIQYVVVVVASKNSVDLLEKPLPMFCMWTFYDWTEKLHFNTQDVLSSTVQLEFQILNL